MPKSQQDIQKLNVIADKLNSDLKEQLPEGVRFSYEDKSSQLVAHFNKQHAQLVQSLHRNIPIKHELIFKQESNLYDLVINEDTYNEVLSQDAAQYAKKVKAEIEVNLVLNDSKLFKADEVTVADTDAQVETPTEEISDEELDKDFYVQPEEMVPFDEYHPEEIVMEIEEVERDELEQDSVIKDDAPVLDELPEEIVRATNEDVEVSGEPILDDGTEALQDEVEQERTESKNEEVQGIYDSEPILDDVVPLKEDAKEISIDEIIKEAQPKKSHVESLGLSDGGSKKSFADKIKDGSKNDHGEEVISH